MADVTTIWELPVPELADAPPDVPRDVIALAEALDPKLTPLTRGLIATRPPSGKIGQRFVAADQNNKEYLDIGTAWVETNPTHGFYPGDLKASLQAADHGPWVYADGRNNIDRAGLAPEFIDLMLALGYPGADGTKIGVPDLRGRFVVNRGTHADIDAVGENEGSAVANRRPKHRHSVVDPGHSHLPGDGRLFATARPGDAANWPGGAANAFPEFTTNRTEVKATGVSVGVKDGAAVDPNAPLDGPAYIVANGFIFSGAVEAPAGEGGGAGVAPRQTTNIVTPNLAAGARDDADVVTLKAGYKVLRVSADHPCRVRLYASPAQRAADAARGVAVEPEDWPGGLAGSNVTPNHGVMMEVILTAANLAAGVYVQDCAPNIPCSSNEGDGAGVDDIAYVVDNTDVAAHVINVGLLWQPTE